MKPDDLPTATGWTLARRAERMNPSVLREILKVTERPGIATLAATIRENLAGAPC
jgi:2-aminoadipate transaminase